MKAAKEVGLSQATISTMLRETLEEWRERVLEEKYNPQLALAQKMEQLADVRAEAIEAWERSKEDSEALVDEQQLRPVYEERTVDGKAVRVKVGEEMRTVKLTKSVEGRLPDSRYLAVVTKCLAEEARLEGLTQETVVKITNNNVAGDQVNVAISWDSMIQRPTGPDMIEAQIAEVSIPPVELTPQPPASYTEMDLNKIHDVKEQPVGEWTAAEKAEMGDETEHLNGDVIG